MSTPPAASDAKAVAGARNVNSLSSGTPWTVMAVSRLTIVRSAAESTGAAAASSDVGSAASRASSACS